MTKALLTVLLLLAVLASATARDLSLTEAIELALRRDPQVQRSELSLAAAQRTLDQRWGLFLPAATVQAGTSYRHPLFTEARPGTDPWSSSASVGLNLQLSAAVGPQLAALEVQRQIASLTRDTRLLALAAQVRRRYYGLVNTRQQLQLLQEDIRLAREQADQTRVRFESGLVSQRVLLQAQLNAERAHLALRQSSAEYQLQVTRFLSIIGLEEPATELTLADDFGLPVRRIDPDQLSERPATALDLASEELALRNAELSLRQEILATRSPTLGLSSSWSSSFAGESWSDSLNLSVSVSMPLDGFIAASGRGQRVDRAELQRQQAQITRDDQLEQHRLTVRDLVAQINQAVEQLSIADMQIDLAEQSLELTRTGFDRGTVERLELERTQRDLLDARISRAAGEYRYALAVTDLAQHLGAESPEALLRELRPLEER